MSLKKIDPTKTKAWSKLTDEQREASNKIADKIIYKFNQKYEAIDNQLYLFMD